MFYRWALKMIISAGSMKNERKKKEKNEKETEKREKRWWKICRSVDDGFFFATVVPMVRILDEEKRDNK